MKKFSIKEIQDMDLTKIVIDKLANSKSIHDCDFEDDELDKHLSEMETLLGKYTYPCLLKMSDNRGNTDYTLVQNVHDVIEYTGEYLDCKSGANAYWDENNELLIKVIGQSFQRVSDKTWHFVTQYVKLFEIDENSLNKFFNNKELEEIGIDFMINNYIERVRDGLSDILTIKNNELKYTNKLISYDENSPKSLLPITYLEPEDKETKIIVEEFCDLYNVPKTMIKDVNEFIFKLDNIVKNLKEEKLCQD